MENPFIVLSEVVQLLDERGITYVLVGSMASSMHGMYRATADIDLIADIKPAQVRPLLEALQNRFYVDEQAVQQAISQQRSFNAIHFDSVFKVDIFIPKAGDFAMQQLERRQLRKIAPDIDQNVYVATAEDMILAKLRWFHAGGGVSETQWRDVLGMIGAAAVELDLEYLQQWAKKLEVEELLEKALAEGR
jgi:hypothetical protein